MKASILVGHVLDRLKDIPDGSVQTCVTSPPYWGLRDYGTAEWEGGDTFCDHKKPSRFDYALNSGLGPTGVQDQASNAVSGSVTQYSSVCEKCGAQRIDNQIGLEKTPQEYVEKIVSVFREVKRVLRDDGTCWANMGDSYAANRGYQVPDGKWVDVGNSKGMKADDFGLKPKDLVGVPWMLAFALRADGWYLRSEIIWCLSGGAFIYARTQKGDMPLMVRDVARLDPSTVKLWNGKKWTQVSGWSRSKRRGTEIEILLRSGERIGCTPTHQWPTSRGLLKASELSIGDLLQSVTIPEPEHPLDTATISRDVAWFVGLYIAEGSRSKDKIQISGHAKEGARWERCRRIALEWGGSASKDVSGNGMTIHMYGKFLNTIIDQFVSGRIAKNKCLAPVCWRYSNEWLRSLLDGYLSGDGGWDEANERWRLGFCRNYNLERDLRTLAARLSFRLVLNPGYSTCNGKKFPSFHGEIRFKVSGHHNCKYPQEIVEIRKARCREVYDIGVADEPHTYALASGIITHNSKPNPMPESVGDRPTKAHEQIFLLSKSPRYFYDIEAIKEESIVAPGEGGHQRFGNPGGKAEIEYGALVSGDIWYGNGTRNKRSVWTVVTQPFPEAHFATFPEALIEPCILAGTSEHGACPECGSPYKRIMQKTGWPDPENIEDDQGRMKASGEIATDTQRRKELSGAKHAAFKAANPDVLLGWEPTCKCVSDKPLKPCLVLDPFCGSGTTGVVALRYHRDFIGCELNPEYASMAERRINNEAPMFNEVEVK
jgi:DNA modification methylase